MDTFLLGVGVGLTIGVTTALMLSIYGTRNLLRKHGLDTLARDAHRKSKEQSESES